MFDDFLSVPVVGFSGSRILPAGCPVSIAVSAAVSAGCDSFVVGCADGVDLAVREYLSGFDSISVSVFSASDYGSGRSSFARRSVAAVKAVSAGGGAWVCLAGSACPPGLVPSSSSSACFCGLGSGSWASLAFAVGCGVPSALWLPAGVFPPASWGFSSCGGGWFIWRPSVVQLSLF